MVECGIKTIIIFNVIYLCGPIWFVWTNSRNNCALDNIYGAWNNQERNLVRTNRKMIEKHYFPPSKETLNLSHPEKHDSSQMDQARLLNELFYKNKTNGFFFEVGSLDGEYMSNTLMFERFHNWTGILVEADPIQFQRMLAKNRNAHMFNLCLGQSGTFISLREKQIPCVSIKEVLDFLAVKHIDYVILDVENDKGYGEPEIMLDIDFENISFGLLQIEVSWYRTDNFFTNGSLKRVGKDVSSEIEMERYYFAKRFMKIKKFELKEVTSIDMIYGSMDGPYQRQNWIAV